MVGVDFSETGKLTYELTSQNETKIIEDPQKFYKDQRFLLIYKIQRGSQKTKLG